MICRPRSTCTGISAGRAGIEPESTHRYALPRHIEGALSAFPGVDFVLDHAGARDAADMLPVALRHRNARLDIHGQGVTELAGMLEAKGGERMLYGTDWPFYIPGGDAGEGADHDGGTDRAARCDPARQCRAAAGPHGLSTSSAKLGGGGGGSVVPGTGVEPARPCEHQILSLARLPIPPPGHGGPGSYGDAGAASTNARTPSSRASNEGFRSSGNGAAPTVAGASRFCHPPPPWHDAQRAEPVARAGAGRSARAAVEAGGPGSPRSPGSSVPG